MNRAIKIGLIAIGLIFAIWLVVIIRQAATGKSQYIEYTIDSVYVSNEGVNDVVFRVKENADITLYVNRGTEIHPLDYYKNLENKKATISYISYKSGSCPIQKIVSEGVVVFAIGK